MAGVKPDGAVPPLRTAEVIAVGSELLGTSRLDTNSLFIAQKLGELGIELRAKAVVGDERRRLHEIFVHALGRADLVLLTGGLGPTDDDLTREVVAAALSLELIEDETITARIRARFERRGMRMPDLNRRQAMVPRGAVALPNANGTAPGLLILAGDRVVVLLPGPPRELQPILSALCEETGALGRRAGRERIHTVSLFTTGRSESHVEEATQPLYSQWREASPPIETTILATPGQVEIHLSLRSDDGPSARRILEDARAQLADALGDSVFTTSGRTLPQVVGERLLERKLTLAAAESCTGGLLLQRLTDVAGSSAYVRGGIVAYDNRVKETLLDVPPDLIARHGAVSEPVAAAMVEGLRARTGADVCVAITGIAGPGGGTEAKPVGTVVIAVEVPGRALEVRTHLFPGGREMVRLQATQSALDRVRRLLD
jgi:nicotinamide-nucleotide amidase